jgi:hypothetical protein
VKNLGKKLGLIWAAENMGNGKFGATSFLPSYNSILIASRIDEIIQLFLLKR